MVYLLGPLSRQLNPEQSREALENHGMGPCHTQPDFQKKLEKEKKRKEKEESHKKASEAAEEVCEAPAEEEEVAKEDEEDDFDPTPFLVNIVPRQTRINSKYVFTLRMIAEYCQGAAPEPLPSVI